MYALESGYRKIIDLRRAWMDKVAAANTEKTAAVEQLQTAAEREKMLQEEIFRMTADLRSSKAELELARQSIASLESRIKSKKHSISRLRRERRMHQGA